MLNPFLPLQSRLTLMIAEATAEEWGARRDADIDPLIEPVAELIRGLLREIVETFLELLEPIYEPETVSEATTPAEWRRLLDEAIESVVDDWDEIVSNDLDEAFDLGVASLNDLIDGVGGLGIAFNEADPRAVAYLRDDNVKRIRGIDDTTKRVIDEIVRDAVADGTSYTQLASRLRAVDGLDNFLFGIDKNGNDRADRIAIFELNDRYSNGQRLFAEQLQEESGLQMLKRRISTKRIRQSHLNDEAEGLIPLEQNFGSGDQSVPSDPNCGCYDIYDLSLEEI